MRIKILALFSTALLWSGTQAIAAPGDDIGSAVRIVNLVTAEYETDARRLAKGDNVRQDELIEVSTDGTGELKLRDETKLALGPGSRLVLDEFVYNPDIAGGAIVLNLVTGTFRFITGVAAKPAYVIRTPTASITVRGTIFDVFVQKSGAAWLLLIEGAIEVCNVWGECLLHDEPGKIIPITADGDVGNPVKWSSLPETPPFESAFPFVVGPPAIDIDTIFTPDDIIHANFPEGPGTQVQDDPPTGGEQATGDDYYPPTGGSGPTGGEQATGDDYYPPTGDDYYPLPPIVGGPTVIVHGGWIDVPTGCKRRKRCDRWNRGIGAKRADRAARRAANQARNANRRRNAKRANRANRAARANRRAVNRAARANRRNAKRANRVNRRAANRARNVNRRRNANRGRNVNRRRNANRARNVNRRRNANRARNANRRRAGNRGRNVNRRRAGNRGRNVNRRRAANRGRRGGGRRGGRRRRR